MMFSSCNSSLHRWVSLYLCLCLCLCASPGFIHSCVSQPDLSRGGPITWMSPAVVSTSTTDQLAINAATPVQSRHFNSFYQLVSGVPDNIQLVPDPAGSGRKVFHLELTDTDPLTAGATRTELAVNYEYTITGVRWYGISLYFPQDWEVDVNPSVVAQIHTSQATLIVSPPVSIVVINNDLFLELHNNFRPVYIGPDLATKSNSASSMQWLGEMVREQWYCFQFRIDWSNTEGSGAIQVYMNNILVYTATNSVNSYETPLGNYPKTGLYLPGKMFVKHRSIYSDFIHVGGIAMAAKDIALLQPCAAIPTTNNKYKPTL